MIKENIHHCYDSAGHFIDYKTENIDYIALMLTTHVNKNFVYKFKFLE